MVKRFGEGQHNEYLAWLANNPAGYVWNQSHSMLHNADYRFITGGRTLQANENPRKKQPVSSSLVKLCA